MYSPQPWIRTLATTMVAVAFYLASSGVPACAESGITGRVTGQTKEGKYVGMVAGAEIEVVAPGGDVVATSKANAQGQFKLSLPPGQYYYRVKADRYKDEDEGRGFEIKRSDKMELFHFALTQGENDPNRAQTRLPEPTFSELTGRVLYRTDEGEQGIPSAVLVFVNDATRQLRETKSRPARNESDEQGMYRITLPAGTWRASVRARAFDRFVDPEPIVISVGGEQQRNFVLERYQPPAEILAAQGIRGTVRIAKGNRAYPPPFAVSLDVVRTSDRKIVHSQTTDISESDFTFDTLPGAYQVVASAPDSEYAKAVSSPVFVFPGRKSNVQLVMRTKSSVDDIIPEVVQPEVEIAELEKPPQGTEMQVDVSDQIIPHPNLQIMVTDQHTSQPMPKVEVLVREVTDRAASVIRAPTDSNGVATFTLTAGKYFALVKHGDYKVVAAKPSSSYIRGRLLLDVEPDRLTKGRFYLDRYRPPSTTEQGIIATVVDAKTGQGIGYAEVAFHRGTATVQTLNTHRNGEARWSEAVPGHYTVAASHPKYMTVKREINFEPGKSRVRLEMRRKPSESAFVIEANDNITGDGISKATVSVVGRDGTRRSALTDTNGRTTWNVAPGSYAVRVTHRDYVLASQTINYSSASPVHRIAMHRKPTGTTLAGMVVEVYDQKRGGGIADASVTIGGAHHAAVTLTTNEYGMVTWPAAYPGEFSVRVTHPDYMTRTRQIDFDPDDPLHRIAMYRRPSEGFTVSGAVMFQSETALGTALIEGAQISWSGPRNVTVLSGSLGAYSANLIGGIYTVNVTPPAGTDYAPLTISGIEVTEDTTRNFILRRSDAPTEPGPTLVDVNGWVLTERDSRSRLRTATTLRTFGSPDWNRYDSVPNASVLWYFPSEGGLPGAVRQVRTDRSGRFSINDLPEQGYSVVVNASGYETLRTRIGVRRGMSDLRLILNRSGGVTPVPPTGKTALNLQITAQLPSLTPISGARIDIKGNQDAASGVSGRDGRFSAQLMPGRYNVQVTHSNYQRADFTVSLSTSAINRDVTLQPRSTPSPAKRFELQLNVVNQYRRAVPNATVTVLDSRRPSTGRPPAPIVRGVTNKSGQYETRLAPGSYPVKVEGSGFNPAGTTVSIADRDVSRTIQVTRKSVGPVTPPPTVPPTVPPTPSASKYNVRLQVLDQTNKGLAGATMTVMLGNNRMVASGRTDARGYYATDLSPGTYLFKASISDASLGGTQVVVSNSDVNRTLRVTRPATLSTNNNRNRLQYVAQYRTPGTSQWVALGSFGSRAEAEAALRSRKIPVKSQTRVVPQQGTRRNVVPPPRRLQRR